MLTIQQHILEQQQRFPGASGEFSFLLSGITIAAKMIQAKVRRAGLNDILGSVDEVNVQGEVQQKLDVYADQALMRCLSMRESVGILASEENELPEIVHGDCPKAHYAVVFDPLDGSSNIDVNVSVGTTFSILKRPAASRDGNPHHDILQPGSKQIAAGYVLYGSSTIMVYSSGHGVHGFTLDPAVGAFVLSHPDIRIPEQGKYYSVNEANADDFPADWQEYLGQLRGGELGRKYGSRYIGSMVADFHRTLLRGGVFLYPPTASHPDGKLRLLYEANPVAFLAHHAGGMASDGRGDILMVEPTEVHQRIPLAVGGKVEMEAFHACVEQRASAKTAVA